MITAFKLAGMFAAHAIWSVSDNGTDPMSPMFVYTQEDGQRKMIRLISDTFESSVQKGRELLESNEMDANDGALLYDGRITIEGTKIDAILIAIRTYFSPGSEALLAVPYTPKKSFFSRFRVHKPKVLEWKNCDDFDVNRALDSFWEGVDSHEQGSKVWKKALDQSK